mgnify:CR=1 FL=1
MKSLLGMLDRDLTFWDLEADPDVDAIAFLADALRQKGIVKDSFKSAVIEREKAAPTGLETERIGIAMPHTTEEHVNRKGLAVGFLKRPVAFRAMGMPEKEVDTSSASAWPNTMDGPRSTTCSACRFGSVTIKWNENGSPVIARIARTAFRPKVMFGMKLPSSMSMCRS